MRAEIDRHLKFVTNCMVNFRTCDEVDKYDMIGNLTTSVTLLTCKIRKFISQEQKKLKTYSQSKFSEQKFAKVISSCKTNIYTSALWIKRANQLNVKFFNIMANIQHNSHIFTSSTIRNLCECQNIRILHCAQYVMTKVDPTDYPHLIKDGSDMFLDFKRQSMLTAKTVYNAMGLNTSKAMKLHFQQYVQELLHPDNNSCD